MWRNGAKRLVDLMISIPALLVLAAPLGLIALAVRAEDRGPAIFRQQRVGRRGRPFRIWKFRTMSVAIHRPQGPDRTHSADPRITRVGSVLRQTGIDEIPQLINVIRGEMSLVGPRPTVEYQVRAYDARQRRRLEVKPGITGLAVVSGRNALSWEQRIDLDIRYIDHWTLWQDFRILVLTLWKVIIKREGLYGPDGMNDSFVDSSAHQPETPEDDLLRVPGGNQR